MKKMVALGLSNDAIRAAVVGNPYTKRPIIRQCRTIPLPAGAVVDGEVVDQATVSGLLKTLVTRGKFPRDNVALVYASRRVLFREATFPDIALKELHETLPFQAKNLIPLPMKDSILDFVPLSREEQSQGNVLHGLIVATLAAGLEKTAKAVESAGMYVTSVDTSAFSLARMFSEDSQEHTVAVINVGSNSTDVIILDKGGPVYLRSVPSGADDVTQAISIALSVPFEDANDIKQHLGLRNVVGDPRLEKAEEIIRETTSQLIVGIRNTLNYYDNDRRYDGTVDDIILTGVGSQLGGFPPVLATSTNKVVRLGDPFSKFALTKQAREQEAPSHSSAYAIVLGLAMGRRPR